MWVLSAVPLVDTISCFGDSKRTSILLFLQMEEAQAVIYRSNKKIEDMKECIITLEEANSQLVSEATEKEMANTKVNNRVINFVTACASGQKSILLAKDASCTPSCQNEDALMTDNMQCIRCYVVHDLVDMNYFFSYCIFLIFWTEILITYLQCC